MKEWEQQQEMKEMQQMGEAGSSHIASYSLVGGFKQHGIPQIH